MDTMIEHHSIVLQFISIERSEDLFPLVTHGWKPKRAIFVNLSRREILKITKFIFFHFKTSTARTDPAKSVMSRFLKPFYSRTTQLITIKMLHNDPFRWNLDPFIRKLARDETNNFFYHIYLPITPKLLRVLDFWSHHGMWSWIFYNFAV